jgi:hypothetical protein
MSPEQAAGRLDLLGPASDVYSLGATLYCLLTGQPPFPRSGEEGPGPLLRKVETGDFPPPRRVKADVPRPLEAICLKAMVRRPDDRYRCVEALASDVRRWLAGEPVTAWPEPWTVRAERWVRKHRVATAATAAALVMALLLGTAGWVYRHMQRQRGREQAEAALAQAVELRRDYRWADAEVMLKQADGWVEQVADSELRRRAAQAKADLELARELDRVRQEEATLVEGKWEPDRVRGKYPAVLLEHGLDVWEGDEEELTRTIQASAVRQDIVEGSRR